MKNYGEWHNEKCRNNLHSNTSLSLDASTALSFIWKRAGGLVLTHPAAELLWHSGLLSQENFNPETPVWMTRKFSDNTRYNAIAISDAKKKGVKAYLTEFKPRLDLALADFRNAELLSFCYTYCSGNHRTLNIFIAEWALKNGLHGIVNLNARAGEVVIACPYDSVFMGNNSEL